MKIIVILWHDPLLKREVCEIHQVKEENLADALKRYRERAEKEKRQGFESKHKFLVVDKVMAFI